MGIKTTRWDSAEHLKTDEDIQLYFLIISFRLRGKRVHGRYR